MKTITVTVTKPEHEVDFYWNYTMTIAIEGHDPITANCWKVATWLPRGASADLDGSGLRNWGDSQPGGWRCLNQDSQECGCPQVRFGYGDEDPDGTPVVIIGLRTDALSVRIRVPEGEDENEFGQRLQNAIDDAASEADVQEPNAEEVWEELGSSCEIEGCPVRVGEAYGAEEIITAWEINGNYYFTTDTDADSPDSSLMEAVADHFKNSYYEALVRFPELPTNVADSFKNSYYEAVQKEKRRRE